MLERGSVIHGRYVVEKRLGAGGMGDVYLARDQKLDREVALKVLKASDLGDDTARARLIREARSAARLDHPGIVQVFDVGGTDQGDAYLVMERVKGRSVRELLREGALGREEALRIVVDLAAALAAAHADGVIHRDVKPDNAMVRDDGRVVLLDFGIVKRVVSPLSDTATPDTPTLDNLTREGSIVGTPAYLAPEQARGRALAATDQWALAVMAYELLSGRIPWEGNDATHVLAQILLDEAPVLSTHAEGVPAEADAAISRALEKEPEARHADVSAFANALLDAFRTEPRETSSEPADTTTPPRSEPLATSGETPPSDVVTPPGSEPLATSSEPSDAATPPRSGPQRSWLVAAAALVLLAGLGVAYVTHDDPPAQTAEVADDPAEDAPPPEVAGPWVVAVLPFSVAGPDEIQYVGTAFTRSISAKLELVDVIRTVDARALRTQLGEAEVDPTSGAQAARALGATHFVLGDVVAAGDSLEVITTLYDRDGDQVVTLEHRGTNDELLTLTERISAELMAERDDLPNAHLTRAAATGTTSVAAMRAYVEGEQALAARDFSRAADAFRLAVATDPEFALAYYRLAHTYNWLNDRAREYEALEEALSRRDSLSPRNITLVEAGREYLRGHYAEALRQLELHVRSYPTDVAAWVMLGETKIHLGVVHGRPIAEARAPFERALELEPGATNVADHLIWIAIVERDADRAAELANRLPDETARWYRLAVELTRSGDEEPEGEIGPQAFMPALFAVPRFAGHHRAIGWARGRSGHYFAGMAASATLRSELVFGRPERALEELRPLRESGPDDLLESAYGLLLLPLFRLEGDPLRATCQEVRELAPPEDDDGHAEGPMGPMHAGLHGQVGAFLRALCAHRLGDDAAARGHLAQIGSLDEPEDCAGLGDALVAMTESWMALDAGDPERALALLDGLPSELPANRTNYSPILASALGRYVRAEALLALSRHEEALGWVVSLPQAPMATRAFEAWSFRRAGEIHAAAGRADEARTSYERYLELRMDSEPAFADEVAEARAALAAL